MDVHESSPAKIAARVRDIVGASPVYLSFDIDALDPGNINDIHFPHTQNSHSLVHVLHMYIIYYKLF